MLRIRNVRARMILYLIAGLGITIRLFFLSQSIPEHFDYFFQDTENLQKWSSQDDQPHLQSFGWEASSIACAIVCKAEGYSDPFGARSGPTAWIAPGVVVPYVIAFLLFGCFSFESILFVFLFSLVCSVVICCIVYRIALKLFSDLIKAALAAASFAILPYDSWIFRVTGHLDFNFVTLGFAALLMASLRYYRQPGTVAAASLGTVAGISGLVFPGFLTAALVAWFVTWLTKKSAESFIHLFVIGIVMTVIVAPYILWQRERLGGLVPVKSNAGFEVYLGNRVEAKGLFNDRVLAMYHPSQNPDEFRKYRELGEIVYVQSKFKEMLSSTSLANFVLNTLRRTGFFYFLYERKNWDRGGTRLLAKRLLWLVPGIVLLLACVAACRQRAGEWWLIIALTVAYSAPYLVTGVMDRYRYPIIPAVCVLGAGLLPTRVKRKGGAGHRQGGKAWIMGRG